MVRWLKIGCKFAAILILFTATVFHFFHHQYFLAMIFLGILFGGLMNVSVMLVNGFKMPVDTEQLDYDDEIDIQNDILHCPMTTETRLNFLADRFYIFKGSKIVSLGDILASSVAIVFFIVSLVFCIYHLFQ